MAGIRQTPNSNMQSVTINYTASASGQNPQLQVVNSPGGSNSQIQFNAGNGGFGGSPNMIWNNANRIFNVLGTVRASNLQGRITTNTTNFIMAGGNVGDILTTDGAGNLSFIGANAAFSNVSLTFSNLTITGTTTTNNLSVTGNATLARANVSGNISASYFIGNGSSLTSIIAANVTGQVGNSLIAGTVYTNAQPNITSVGTLTSLNVTGNTTASYFIGNGSQLTGLPASYANSNVANYLPTYTGDITASNITLSGNVSGSYILGNGSQLTGLPESYANSNVANYLPTYNGNIAANIVADRNDVTIYPNADEANLAWTFSSNAFGPNTSAFVAPTSDANTIGAIVYPGSNGQAVQAWAEIPLFANSFITESSGNIFSGAVDNIIFQTNFSNTGNASTWTFDNTGNLILPGNAWQVNYANGTQVPLGGGLPESLTNNGYYVTLQSDGDLAIPSRIIQGGWDNYTRQSHDITCLASTATDIWVAASNWVTSAKLTVQVESRTDTDYWQDFDTMTCEIVMAKKMVDGVGTGSSISVYGIVHTSDNPLATFDSYLDGSDRVVVTCTPVASITDPVYVKVRSTESGSASNENWC